MFQTTILDGLPDGNRITIDSWDQLPDAASGVSQYIYRGHRDPSWSLSSALERYCSLHGGCPRVIERQMCREFRRRFHNYSNYVPLHGDDLEWLSIMQHHGSPTRLVDFTYSIYVAAYFALEHADSDCAIWCVDREWATDAAAAALQKSGKPSEYMQEPTELTAVHFKACFLDAPYVLTIAPVNPFRLTQRLTIQMGVFLVAGDLGASFEENLKAMSGWERHIKRIVIPARLRRGALEHLYEMNMTRTTLFPGLDGFAQSLGVFHPLLKPNRDGMLSA